MLAAIRAQICAAVRCAASLVLPSLIFGRTDCNQSQPSIFQKAQYPAIYSTAHRRAFALPCNSLSSPGITTIALPPSTKSKGYIIGMAALSLTWVQASPAYSATISTGPISVWTSFPGTIFIELKPDL